MAKKKKEHKVKVAKTGARAIAEAAGIFHRHGVKPDGKKEKSKKACRKKIRHPDY